MKKLAWSALGVVLLFGLAGMGCQVGPSVSLADDEGPSEDDREFELADGRFVLTTPEDWKRKKPATNIVEHEFQVPASEGDERPGRVTVMGAGGSIEDNIQRWIGQFSQPDGSSTKEKTKRETLKVAGQEIKLVEVSGTYLDKPPFAGGGVERENYRMLAAIVITKKGEKKTGNYFIKFVGPNQTVEDHAEGFRKMIEGLKERR